ncbi:MAG: FtsW/RodA/SpoVE family cell cycle protein, partial [Flavobacteriales bacterium]|nr:FtsW/RodA/SpoVE family cell cycle protein [Flavobacteriales bacterium]
MVALILGVISLLAVYSSIASLAVKHDGGTGRFLFKHLLMLASGGLIMYWASRLKHGIYSRLSQLLLGLTAGLLLLTLLTGSNINDASRWLRIPLLGVTFQTSDLAKVVLVVYVARALAKYREELGDIRVVVRHVLLPVLVICGLILPANFSTAAVLFAVCFLLMFVGGV